MTGLRHGLTAFLVTLTVGGWWAGPAMPEPTEFRRALGPRTFAFPEDHGSHPDFATEWWYLTGHLATDGGGDLGFQATWFRRALTAEQPVDRSSLAVRDVILFHGGFTDVERQKFFSTSASSRAAANWAGSSVGSLGVWLLDNRLETAADGSWRASFEVEGRRLDLRLRPFREPLLHGRTPGLSPKGTEPGEASYYVSQTRLEVTGRVQREPGGELEPVRGRAWFDHEFFSQQLAPQQAGWDWFSVALDDGTDLMVFHLRNVDGSLAETSAGTLRTPEGQRLHLGRGDFQIEVLERWRSPLQSKVSEPGYPARWRIHVPSRDLLLEVEPMVADQEHRDQEPGGMAYWEGLCRFEGRHSGQEAGGFGYVELVGYQGKGPSGL